MSIVCKDMFGAQLKAVVLLAFISVAIAQTTGTLLKITKY